MYKQLDSPQHNLLANPIGKHNTSNPKVLKQALRIMRVAWNLSKRPESYYVFRTYRVAQHYFIL
jgi:hypothetical protein